jgi:hypothetical protein
LLRHFAALGRSGRTRLKFPHKVSTRCTQSPDVLQGRDCGLNLSALEAKILKFFSDIDSIGGSHCGVKFLDVKDLFNMNLNHTGMI